MFEGKIEKLETWFSQHQGTITAFSGGVDSSLVAFLSKKFLPETSIACVSNSESLKRSDFQLAIDFCKQYEIPLEVIKTREIHDPAYNKNPADRCFYCKNHLYSGLKAIERKYPGYTILNGTNIDDYGDYRPGLKAADNYAIRSPLAECAICKQEVRDLARFFGLPNWDKPASPCLSSRISYGQRITKQKLEQVESAEELLNQFGFDEVRVRYIKDTARIEVPLKLVKKLEVNFESIKTSIEKLGFHQCVIDKEGLISGKLNRQLNLKNERAV